MLIFRGMCFTGFRVCMSCEWCLINNWCTYYLTAVLSWTYPWHCITGFQWLASIPKKAGDKTVVISCEQDKNICQAALKAGIDVVSAEFILTGVLRQEVDVNRYPLVVSGVMQHVQVSHWHTLYMTFTCYYLVSVLSVSSYVWSWCFWCWLFNIPATSYCMSGRIFPDRMSHWDRSCRTSLLSHPLTIYWHRANQS